jgi:hypothetical protein
LGPVPVDRLLVVPLLGLVMRPPTAHGDQPLDVGLDAALKGIVDGRRRDRLVGVAGDDLADIAEPCRRAIDVPGKAHHGLGMRLVVVGGLG